MQGHQRHALAVGHGAQLLGGGGCAGVDRQRVASHVHRGVEGRFGLVGLLRLGLGGGQAGGLDVAVAAAALDARPGAVGGDGNGGEAVIQFGGGQHSCGGGGLLVDLCAGAADVDAHVQVVRVGVGQAAELAVADRIGGVADLRPVAGGGQQGHAFAVGHHAQNLRGGAGALVGVERVGGDVDGLGGQVGQGGRVIVHLAGGNVLHLHVAVGGAVLQARPLVVGGFGHRRVGGVFRERHHHAGGGVGLLVDLDVGAVDVDLLAVLVGIGGADAAELAVAGGPGAVLHVGPAGVGGQ